MALSRDTIKSLQHGRDWATEQAERKAASLEQLTKEAADCAADRRNLLVQAREFNEILCAYDPDAEHGDSAEPPPVPGIGGAELVRALWQVAGLLATAGLPAELHKTPRVDMTIDVENAWVAKAIFEVLEMSGAHWHIDQVYLGNAGNNYAWQYGRTYSDVLDLEVRLRWPTIPVDADPAAAGDAEVPA